MDYVIQFDKVQNFGNIRFLCNQWDFQPLAVIPALIATEVDRIKFASRNLQLLRGELQINTIRNQSH
jgi:hypothetical protein